MPELKCVFYFDVFPELVGYSKHPTQPKGSNGQEPLSAALTPPFGSTPPPPDRLRQHPGSPATLPSSPFLDASREEVAEVVMVEPTPPRPPPPSRTFIEESDTVQVQDTCKECEEEFMIPWDLCCDKTRHLCEQCCYEHKDCKVFLSEERARCTRAGLDI